MNLKVGEGRVDWKVITGFLMALVTLITIISYASGLQTKISKVEDFALAIAESKIDRNLIHVDIATLKECARNTEAKLKSIEDKLDSILMSQRSMRNK